MKLQDLDEMYPISIDEAERAIGLDAGDLSARSFPWAKQLQNWVRGEKILTPEACATLSRFGFLIGLHYGQMLARDKRA